MSRVFMGAHPANRFSARAKAILQFGRGRSAPVARLVAAIESSNRDRRE